MTHDAPQHDAPAHRLMALLQRRLPAPLYRAAVWIAEHPVASTLIYAGVWVLLFFDWLAWYQLPRFMLGIGFTLSPLVCALWIDWARRRTPLVRYGVYSGAYVFVWHWLVWATDAMVWDGCRALIARVGLAATFMLGLAWAVWFVEQASRYYDARRRGDPNPPAGLNDAVLRLCQWLQQAGPRLAQRIRPAVRRAVEVAAIWLLWLLTATWLFGASRKALLAGAGHNNWNPFDLHAWYYRHDSRKLDQSVTTLTLYSVAFVVLFLLILQVAGCREIYEMPAGGGEQKQIQQVLKVQKVIKKKFVINPFSAIVFNPPPIDEVKLQLLEITKHAYTVGYGKGSGAGFSGGTARGKVRFIRLEYAGGDWDQDFGVGADLNMLIEYGIRTQHKVAQKTESRTIGQLRNFPVGKSPPVVYITGQRSISLSKSQINTLREYLIDKHGMLFADNGGSGHWHSQLFSVMHQVLPNVEPVRVPLDDPIHRVPYPIPFLPYVAPHGGKDAWGWKVDGRWVCYYHPGDIGDAWADGHAGVKREIWEACYQLGVNVIFYAHAEYNKWLDARDKKDE